MSNIEIDQLSQRRIDTFIDAMLKQLHDKGYDEAVVDVVISSAAPYYINVITGVDIKSFGDPVLHLAMGYARNYVQSLPPSLKARKAEMLEHVKQACIIADELGSGDMDAVCLLGALGSNHAYSELVTEVCNATEE